MTKVKDMHFSLAPCIREEIKNAKKRGSYKSYSEYISDLVRKDMGRRKAQEEFDAFIKEGLESPVCTQSENEIVKELGDTLRQIR